jgi:hypothetical protein
MQTQPLRHATDYFKAGGTLHLGSPSYVKRPADDELFQQTMAGKFCYVLTSRQRGKSSLMVRTAERLRREGVMTVVIDLSGLGTMVTREQWYLGMIMRLTNDLRLGVDAERWWRERAAVGPVQRFTDFLHDVVLHELPGRVVIFLDEIDSTLKLDFTDDFFAAIRVMYNLRASSPEYDRLTFVLLGVATPTDLIKDRNRTPFNIGTRIELQEISRGDAQSLEAGLDERFPGCGKTILDRIFHWTSGHPYLTQRICVEVAEEPPGDLRDEQVDAIVERLFLADDARKKENNLNYVDSAVKAIKDRRPLMKLYRRVFEGQRVDENKQSPLHERLRLIGLVRAHDGVLDVRNQIYRRVFDIPWIKANTPRSTGKIVSILASLTIVVTLAAAIFFYQSYQAQAQATRINQSSKDFQEASSPVVKLNNLRLLCEIDGGGAARDLVYGPQQSAAQRLELFERLDEGVGDDLRVVVGCLQPQALDQYLPPAESAALRSSMLAAVCRAGLKDDDAAKQAFGGSLACPS